MARADYEHLSREELLTVIERLDTRYGQAILRFEAKRNAPIGGGLQHGRCHPRHAQHQ